jgi:uncharacterized protein (DUF1800 family)
VQYLAHHPATARHVATELVRRFVEDTPPAGLVGQLAETYRRGGTAIAPMLRELFASREFAVSVGQKYRRPLEAAAATVRTLGVTADPGGEEALTKGGQLKGAPYHQLR